jgi:hypothetical protein
MMTQPKRNMDIFDYVVTSLAAAPSPDVAKFIKDARAVLAKNPPVNVEYAGTGLMLRLSDGLTAITIGAPTGESGLLPGATLETPVAHMGRMDSYHDPKKNTAAGNVIQLRRKR